VVRNGDMIGSDGPIKNTALLTIHNNFLAGDWGTSNLRLFLCDAAGTALDSSAGPGAAESSGRFEAVFSGLTASWRERHGPLPAVLCGMVGSNFGWRQAPYVSCPASPDQIGAGCVSPDDAASRNIWLGNDGALAGAVPGSLLLESSTLSVSRLRSLVRTIVEAPRAEGEAKVTSTTA